jgi:sulfur-carrier protein adenylyltransferase/sulfurtransferase
MRLWWLVDSARLGAERQAVELLAREEGWFCLERWWLRDGRLCLDGIIAAHDNEYPVRLVYPDQFPLVPAWIEPQEEVRWSGHQYGKRTLCLEWRPDNWVPTATGADVLRSALRLLTIEDPLGGGGRAAPSDHRIDEAQVFGWLFFPVLVGSGCLGRLKAGAPSDVAAVRWLTAGDLFPIYVHDTVDMEGQRRPPSASALSGREKVPVILSHRPVPSRVESRSDLLDADEWDPEDVKSITEATSGVILFLGEEPPKAYVLGNEKPFNAELYVLPEDGGLRTSPGGFRENIRICLVGVGSVGSKLAESLVRAGVRHLTVIDGDIMLPGNLERHTLTWRDVGARKAPALRQRLLDIAPGADIKAAEFNLNWQRSSRTHAWQVDMLARADVIIDATGDLATTLFLGAISEANKRPFVSVEVFEGGCGGLVATTMPDRDPPFAHGRAAFLAWCESQDATPPERGPRRYEALSQDGVPMPADDAAVTVMAGHAARIVLDIVDGTPPSSEAAWMLIGLRKAWLFEGHGHVIRLDVGRRPDLTEEEADEAARQFALELAREACGEASDTV